MRSQPLPSDASRRRAEEQFKTTKKVNSETKANPPRLAEGREDGAPSRTSVGQGSSRQGYCKSRRGGSEGP